ncbi:MAG: tRNA (N6-isopentenyl adenosine(37)-C2)-methylthiotransferase MiaB [Flavobacteriales bacterium]|nr:tRNA (N6-isopentenyl adenosine(37)-C2)-methylthiotransferase MiaB [Flavobacteriales bacterium]MCB9170432.1 tRNA (N6-isopentenyl adenosine(37)-C2)-methylthiotransferase MiaB [Flavobacteriales bacterium]MCB9193360.1 tRNA (N6-isopentenyl adenosine(37)-C2)-methylthiotransferase MiaB [Flavobacteriales bacterium]
MNLSDSEIVASILAREGYERAERPEEADLVLLNTCSIRDKAEQTVLNRLDGLTHLKRKNPEMKVGVLGCMAERMRADLLEKKQLVDLVVGPDAYRSLPGLLDEIGTGQKAVNVLLSRDETYADIAPVRLQTNGVTAFISIMRGCDNMCAFCVVPFTRGRERSREPITIVREARDLVRNAYREVTLLGQNVDSFHWSGADGRTTDFADLLAMVAEVDPLLRIRFSTSHPKDMTDKVLEVMAHHPNICSYIHLPVQSGSSAVLQRMNRGYDRDRYLDRIAAIRHFMPDAAISTDIITGFCGETEEDHQDTLSLMREVRYDMAYMFKYSERPRTLAARNYADDVPDDVKGRRLQEVIDLQMRHAADRNQLHVGKEQETLVEGVSKRSADHLFGRNTQNAVVILPKCNAGHADLRPGDLITARIRSATSGSLQGELVRIDHPAPIPKDTIHA